MILRVLTTASALAGAAGLSQFPEFSQQYAQRLAGAVDELHHVIADFDADAAATDASREEALVALAASSQIGANRARTMASTIRRHRHLQADLEALQNAGPFRRASHIAHFRDMGIATRAMQDFRPALPLTFEGAVFAMAGLALGWILITSLIWLLRLPFKVWRSRTA